MKFLTCTRGPTVHSPHTVVTVQAKKCPCFHWEMRNGSTFWCLLDRSLSRDSSTMLDLMFTIGCFLLSLGIVFIHGQTAWLVLVSAAPGQGEAECRVSLELIHGLVFIWWREHMPVSSMGLLACIEVGLSYMGLFAYIGGRLPHV